MPCLTAFHESPSLRDGFKVARWLHELPSAGPLAPGMQQWLQSTSSLWNYIRMRFFLQSERT